MAEKKGTAKEKKPSLAEEGTTDSAKEEIVRADLWVLKSERGLITDIQKRYFKEDGPLRISEVIRAGIYALDKIPDTDAQEIVNTLIRLKQR
jgi:hypothetical protein